MRPWDAAVRTIPFYEDEVDIHLNPKLGADWMMRGKQKKVATPGQNRKHYLAGALHAGTGNVTYVASDSKDTDLFLSLLQTLKRDLSARQEHHGSWITHHPQEQKHSDGWQKPKFIVLFSRCIRHG